MSERPRQTVSIRIRLDGATLERIDKVAGRRNRQRFITDAIMGRLDDEYPPAFLELSHELKQLTARVEYLERVQSPTDYMGSLSNTARTKLCRDELDCKLLVKMLQVGGCTTTELAEALLGGSSKRTTILNRINQINERAEKLLDGRRILVQHKGIVEGKRGAWWLSDPKDVTSD